MKKSLQKSLAYLLLASFFVLLTPKEWWHECDHHATIESNKAHFDSHDDCSFCDYHVGFIDYQNIKFFSFNGNVIAPEVNPIIAQYSQIEFHLFQLRAPPSLI